jgi:hypothetical protein
MHRCPQCHDLSIAASSTLFTTLDSTVACPTCLTVLCIRRTSTNYLVIAYMCLRAILSSVLPGGYHVEIFMEANVIIALAVMQFLLVEYEVVDG